MGRDGKLTDGLQGDRAGTISKCVWGISLFGRWPDAGDVSDFAVADESLAVATAKRRDLAGPCVDGYGVPAFCMDR